MHIIPPADNEEFSSTVIESDPEVPNERTSLLRNKANGNNDEDNDVQVDVVSVREESAEPKQTTLGLLSDRHFWALTFIVFVVLGSVSSSYRHARAFVLTNAWDSVK